jgi:deoxyribonuclease V
VHLKTRHRWDVGVAEAVELQRAMSAEIVSDKPLDLKGLRLVAGVDVSVKGEESLAAVVVLRFPSFEVVETSLARMPTPFPYVPGLLSFREGPVLERAFRALKHEPDVFLFDGMGRAHPRRIGIACHLGLWLERPTVGCGKTLLVGTYVEPPDERGAHVPLVHRGETVGEIVRTRPKVKPVFISVGHLADLPSSVEFVMRCTGRFRLPEPVRHAHNAAAAAWGAAGSQATTTRGAPG